MSYCIEPDCDLILARIPGAHVPIHVQTLDDRPTKDPKLTKTFYGTLADLTPQLLELNRRGAGVFFVVNDLPPGKSRKAGNVTRVRALFADSDKPERQMEVEAEIERRGLPPTLIVESSTGKFHYYWAVDYCPLDRFKPIQQAIAAGLGTDPSVCDLPRIMRMLGFSHMKGVPFTVRAVGGTGVRYQMAEIEKAFPSGQATRPAYLCRSAARQPSLPGAAGTPSKPALILRAHLNRFGGLITPAVHAAIAETQKGERHALLRAIAARLVPLGWPDADIRALVLPAALAVWRDVDAAELAGRMNSLLSWTRQQEAAKLAAQPTASDRANRLAAAFGGGTP